MTAIPLDPHAFGDAMEKMLGELMVAGYTDAHLKAAFSRMQRIMADAVTGAIRRPAKVARINPVAVAIEGDIPKATNTRPPRPRFTVTPPPENAKAIAQKALGTSGMSASVIKVAFALLEHFNLKTGRCDPGMPLLAKKLHIEKRTVQRAIKHLVDEGLFARTRHGGRGHANAYQINWVLMAERAAAADQKPKATILSSDSDNSVAQNLLRKPDSDSMMGKPLRRRVAPVDRRQGHLALPIEGGKGKAEEAVRAKLHRELTAHLTAQHLPHDRPAYARDLTASMDADRVAAVAAELRRAGDGLPIILDGIARVTSTKKATG